MTGALRAEWTKARTAPSTGWLLLLVVLAMVGVALAATGTFQVDECGEEPCAVDPPRLGLSGVRLAQVGAAVLGVLVVTSEYATGTITSTLAAVPRRGRVLAAKATVVATLVLGASVLGVTGAVLVARRVLPGRGVTADAGYHAVPVVQDLTQRAAVGTVVYLVLVALLGTGLGLLVRDTGACVTLVLTVLLVAPLLATLVADPDWQRRIARWSPMDAGLAVQVTRDLTAQPIAPWAGLAVLGGYAVTALAAGGLALRLRDAS